MRTIIRLLRRLFRRESAPRAASQEVGTTVREIQQKLLYSARENAKPRIGA